MIRTNTGMRISFGTKLRTLDTAPLEAAITRVVASPSDSALMTLVLMASVGHRPSTCTRLEFCLMRPLWNRLRNSAAVIMVGLLIGVMQLAPCGAAQNNRARSLRP